MFFHRKRFDMTPEEAQKRLQQEDIYLLDVRSKEEYEEGHLPQAHLIPVQTLSMHLEQLPKHQPIFLYCHSGQRANHAKTILQKAGFQEVYNIGGVIQWPYDLIK